MFVFFVVVAFVSAGQPIVSSVSLGSAKSPPPLVIDEGVAPPEIITIDSDDDLPAPEIITIDSDDDLPAPEVITIDSDSDEMPVYPRAPDVITIDSDSENMPTTKVMKISDYGKVPDVITIPDSDDEVPRTELVDSVDDSQPPQGLTEVAQADKRDSETSSISSTEDTWHNIVGKLLKAEPNLTGREIFLKIRRDSRIGKNSPSLSTIESLIVVWRIDRIVDDRLKAIGWMPSTDAPPTVGPGKVADFLNELLTEMGNEVSIQEMTIEAQVRLKLKNWIRGTKHIKDRISFIRTARRAAMRAAAAARHPTRAIFHD